MKHEWDNDACCIHCSMDGADWPKGEKLPPCPVWDEDTRAENRRRNPVDDPYDISEEQMLDQECWDDYPPVREP